MDIRPRLTIAIEAFVQTNKIPQTCASLGTQNVNTAIDKDEPAK